MRANIPVTIRYIKQWLLECQETDKRMMIVMIGPPGCGKSTIINSLSAEGLVFVVASTDDLVDEYATANGVSYNIAHQTMNWKEAQSRFKRVIRESANNRVSFIIDRTNMGEKSRRGYFDAVRKLNFMTVALDMQCDDKVLQQRLDDRAKATGKYISKGILKDMFARYNAPTSKEGFDKIIEVLTH